MTSAKTVILLPGTGSDEVFVRAAFAAAVTGQGWHVHAPRPRGGAEVIAGYRAVLDAAAADGPVIAGGISLGAHVAAAWALDHPAACAGLLLAMPAWSGPAAGAPTAELSRAGAELVAAQGVDAAVAIVTAGVSGWLAGELRRAWRRHGPALAAELTAAAREPAPLLAELATLDVPAGVCCCTDDPVHPAEVAERWAAALPRAVLRRTTLAAVGADPGVLGRETVAAFRQAATTAAAQPG